MKLLIMKFSPPSCHFIPFGPNILLNTLFSNTSGTYFSCDVKEQVSYNVGFEFLTAVAMKRSILGNNAL
jgi:hypothetical protein